MEDQVGGTPGTGDVALCCTGAQRADTQLRGDRGTPGDTTLCDITLCHSSDSTARNPTDRGHTALLAFTLEVKCHLFHSI